MRSFSRFEAATAAGGLATFGSSVTWTGLPFYVATLSHDVRNMAWLFTAQSVTGVVTAVFAGHFADSFRPRFSLGAPSALNALALIIVALSLDGSRLWLYYAIGIFSALCGQLSGVAIRSWIGSLVPAERLKQEMAGRNAVLSSAKLIGTASGPIIFSAVGTVALLLDAATLLFSAVIYFVLDRGAWALPKSTGGQGGPGLLASIFTGWVVIRGSGSLMALLACQAALSLLGPPCTALLVMVLAVQRGADSLSNSLFWIVGFAANILVSACIRRGFTKGSGAGQVALASFILTFVGVAISLNSSALAIFLVGIFLVTTSRTMISITLYSRMFPELQDQTRGRVVACFDWVADLVGLGALLFVNSLNPNAIGPIVFGYVGLAALAGGAGALVLIAQENGLQNAGVRES